MGDTLYTAGYAHARLLASLASSSGATVASPAEFAAATNVLPSATHAGMAAGPRHSVKDFASASSVPEAAEYHGSQLQLLDFRSAETGRKRRAEIANADCLGEHIAERPLALWAAEITIQHPVSEKQLCCTI